MSEIQETDKVMRIAAVIGGVVAIVESFLELIGFGLMPWGMPWGMPWAISRNTGTPLRPIPI